MSLYPEMLKCIASVAHEHGAPVTTDDENKQFTVIIPSGVKRTYALKGDRGGFDCSCDYIGDPAGHYSQSFLYEDGEIRKPGPGIAGRILDGAVRDMIVRHVGKQTPKKGAKYTVDVLLNEGWKFDMTTQTATGLDVLVTCEKDMPYPLSIDCQVLGDGWPAKADILAAAKKAHELVGNWAQRIRSLYDYTLGELGKEGLVVEEDDGKAHLKVTPFVLSTYGGDHVRVVIDPNAAKPMNPLDLEKSLKLLTIAKRCTLAEMTKRKNLTHDKEMSPLTTGLELV